MKIKFTFVLTFAMFLALGSQQINADVKKESMTQMDFKGGLGTIMKMFGAEKPFNSVEYYKGNQFRSDTMDKKNRLADSQIIDVNKEVILQIDHKKKKYTKMTFQEWREMMRKQMAESQNKQSKKPSEEPEMEWRFSVKVTDTHSNETVNNIKAQKFIMEIHAYMVPAGSPQNIPEANQGGIIVKSTMWMDPNAKGTDDVAAYQKAFGKKIGKEFGNGGPQQIMAGINQNNPGLGKAMEELERESAKLKGQPVKIVSVFKNAGGGQAGDSESSDDSPMTSMGSLVSGFGKKLAKSRTKKEDAGVIMTSTTEIKNIDTSALDSTLFEVPTGYKEAKQK